MIVTIWPFPTHKRMTVFTVHEPPHPPVDRIDRAEALVFLKDGFTFGAFFLGPVWLLANRLWLALAGYLGIVALAALALKGLDASPGWHGLLVLGLNAIVAWEAHALKVAKLDGEGWTLLGSVSGTGLRECERRFFEHWLASQPARRQGQQTAMSSGPASASAVASGTLRETQLDRASAQATTLAKSVFAKFRRKG